MSLECKRCGSLDCSEISRRMITNKHFVGILNAAAGGLGMPGMPVEPIADEVTYRCKTCGHKSSTIIHDGKS